MGIRSAALTALAVAFAIIVPGVVHAACSEDSVWLRGDFGQARFSVTIADTEAERARGLMFVENMPRGQGMLFVYPTARPVSFWMRNTLIPLDIIYADARGEVIRIAADAVPGDETGLPSGGPAQYVLEINGGLAAQMGIAPGAQMRHPVIGPMAAWPCD